MHIAALEWTDRFQRYLLTERQVSPHTAAAYRLEIEALVRFCEKNQVETWADLDVKRVRMFAARSHARGLSPQSVQRRLSAVRTFLKFLNREGVIIGNPALLIQAPKSGRPLPKVLDADQMARLLEIPGVDVYTIRDRAIMELLYSSGLRLIELIRLNCADMDLAQGVATVLGKGNITRIVPVGSFAIRALQHWLRMRR